jgi:predicted PurR-regulated permease PerM
MPLALGVIISIIAHPLHQRIHMYVKNANIAAFLSTIIVFTMGVLPMVLFIGLVLQELTGVYLGLRAETNYLTPNFQMWLKVIKEYLPFISLHEINFNNIASQASQWILSQARFFLSSIADFIIKLVLMLMVVFYVLKDAEVLRQKMNSLSPLSDKYDALILERFRTAVRTVVGGNVLICALQGILAGIVYMIFGAPFPALLGFATMLTAFIPTLGTAIIWVPISLFLFLTGNIASALGIFAFGMIVIATLDNVLAPILIEKGVNVHPALILFSILGGLRLLGAVGVLLGPLILALWIVLFEIFEKEYLGRRPRAISAGEMHK